MNKKGFHSNIEKDTVENNNFRKVLYTSCYMQLVLMSLKPGEDIGLEVHGVDQFFRFEKGEGKVVIGDNEYNISDGDVIVVPAGVSHNVINTSETEELKLYTIYAPPHHKDQILIKTKEEAENNMQEFDGLTTE
jgi:mannose-6-phosphate isomerase-like protein (cupin superfamily)